MSVESSPKKEAAGCNGPVDVVRRTLPQHRNNSNNNNAAEKGDINVVSLPHSLLKDVESKWNKILNKMSLVDERKPGGKDGMFVFDDFSRALADAGVLLSSKDSSDLFTLITTSSSTSPNSTDDIYPYSTFVDAFSTCNNGNVYASNFFLGDGEQMTIDDNTLISGKIHNDVFSGVMNKYEKKHYGSGDIGR